MKLLKMYFIILTLFIIGCSAEYGSSTHNNYQSKEAFLDYIMSGYVKDTETLYDSDCQQLKELHKALGLSECDNIYTISKGKFLVFEKDQNQSDPNEFRILVLCADVPPKLIRSLEELWDGQCRVFYFSDKNGMQCLDKNKFRKRNHPYTPSSCVLSKNDYIKFYNGHIIDGDNSICMDDDARFVCCQYISKVPVSRKDNNKALEPVYIISVDNPKVMVQSQLKYLPETMTINNNKLYIGTMTGDKSLPVFHFEVFDIMKNNELNCLKDYYVNPPWGFAVWDTSIWEYDYQTHSQIIRVMRDLPFRNNRYLYSYDENRFRNLPYFKTFRFINPGILKNSVQYVDVEKFKKHN
jgi:hypothetical protein